MKVLFSIFVALSIGGTSLASVLLGDLGPANGVTGPDSRGGTGYLLFNPNGLGPHRMNYQPHDADNFVVVVYEAGTWSYYSNDTSFPFLPDQADVLVATLNFSNDTAQLLEGQNSVIEGISAGYSAGDLVVTPDFWNGQGNDGEFGLSGTEITLNVDPAWWSVGADPAIVPNVPNVDHKAAANLGQAKWMAKLAYDTILARNPTLAAAILGELVGDPATHPFSEWEPAIAPNGGDRAALLLGQLKAISAPFYNQIHLAAPAWLEAEMIKNGTRQPNTHLPWGPDVGPSENRAAANLGQLKALFSLPLGTINDNNLDADQDGLSDSFEQQIIASSGGAYTSLSDLNPDDDLDGDYLSNYHELLNGSDPLSPTYGQTYTPTQWRDFYHAEPSTSNYGTSLTKQGSTSWSWNSGAKSTRLMEGDGGITFRLPVQEDPKHYAICGLSVYDSGPSYFSLDYAFYRYGLIVAILENGVRKRTFGAASIDAVFTIRRIGSTITYYIDEKVVYTSSTSSGRPLFMDSSLLQVGSQITHAGSYGFSNGDSDRDGLPDSWELANAPDLNTLSPESDHDLDFFSTSLEYRTQSDPFEPNDTMPRALPIVWESSTTVQDSFNEETFTSSIIRTRPYNSWNAGIHSAGYIHGDGSVLFRVADGQAARMVALSANSADDGYTELNHAIYISAYLASCYENGVRKVTLGGAGEGDVFEVKRSGSEITYLINGVVKYTSEVTYPNLSNDPDVVTRTPLLIDTSIVHSGKGIEHIASIGMTYDSGNEDADNDGAPAWLETLAGLSDSNPDQDGDGLLDGTEFFTYRSSPFSLDTDGDGLPDGWEGPNNLKAYDPNGANLPDTDNDGLTDLLEFQIGTFPDDSDSDDDFVPDGVEYYGL